MISRLFYDCVFSQQYYLDQLGGLNCREALNAYFRVVMDSTLAAEFSWTGKKCVDGTFKNQLYNTKLMRIFFGNYIPRQEILFFNDIKKFYPLF